MKIGILTASHTNNNGTTIQAIAMQELFQSVVGKKDKVEIINYRCLALESSNKLLNRISIRELLYVPYRVFNSMFHCRFRKKYFIFSKDKYKKDNLTGNTYDKIIVGSDQVWNLNITGNDFSYYLNFSANVKRYSYSVSFGCDNLKEWDTKYNISKYLNELDVISVRETSYVDKLKEINVAARYDLDPVLMVDKSIFIRYMSARKPKRKYILLYFVKNDMPVIDWAKEYGKKNKLDIILISNSIKKINGIKVKSIISVEDWMTYMYNAYLVITNSYHGLSFSIAMNKDFYYVDLYNSVQSNERMLDILEKLNLSHRIWNPEIDESDISIDWKNSIEILKILQDNSQRYINYIVSSKGDESI